MQKIRTLFLYGMTAAVAAAMFFTFTLRVRAQEASFTHTHKTSCYTTQTVSCESRHTKSRQMDTGTYHCTKCGIMTAQWVDFEKWSCPVKNTSWEENGRIYCKTCGTQHSAWSTAGGDHTYQETRKVCGLEEGETTATLSVTADTGWTNSGVTLQAQLNVLKQDLTSKNITLSWENGSLYVTENGVYSVTASDEGGRSVSASMEISCIDKNTPVINSVSSDTGNMSQTGIGVSVSAQDGESGLHDTPYSLDGGQTWGNAASLFLEEGRDVQFVVRDKAGNTASVTLRRSDFPYPPKPSPSPMPSPSAAPLPSPETSSEKTPDSVNDTPSFPGSGNGVSESAGSSSSSLSSSGKKKGTSQEDTGVVSGKGDTGEQKETNVRNGEKEGSVGEKDSIKNGEENKKTLPENEKTAQTGESAGTDRYDKDRTEKEKETEEESGESKESEEIEESKESRENEGSKESEAGILQAEGENLRKQQITEARLKNAPQAGEEVLSAAGKNKRAVSGAFLRMAAGGILLALGLGMLFRIFWLQSAVLYCYNGGEEYKRIGWLHLRRKKQEFELYLPEELLEIRGMPHYRLMLKSRLVKKHEGEDLVVRGEDYKLRQPLEECVDFVL